MTAEQPAAPSPDDTRPFEGAAEQEPTADDETLIVYGPQLPPAVPLFMAPGYLRAPWPAWDSLGGVTFQRCGGCQAVYADGDAGAEDCYLGRMWASAIAAGWRESPLRGLLCPDCRTERDEQDAESAIPWDDRDGTEVYEQRLAAHVAALTQFDKGIRRVAGEQDRGNGAARERVRLRLDDFRDRYGITEAGPADVAA